MRLALIVLLISACDLHDEHHIEATWSIDRYGDGVATTVACPTGWTTVRLVAVDPSSPTTRTVDTFSCDAQQGTSSFLAADSYLAWLEVVDGNKVLATSPPTTTEVTSFNPILIADIYLDAGYATVAWPPVTEQVVIELTGTTDITTYFDSSAGAGLIGPVPAGRYQVAASIGSRREMLPDLVITAPNGLADLGMLSIPK